MIGSSHKRRAGLNQYFIDLMIHHGVAGQRVLIACGTPGSAKLAEKTAERLRAAGAEVVVQDLSSKPAARPDLDLLLMMQVIDDHLGGY